MVVKQKISNGRPARWRRRRGVVTRVAEPAWTEETLALLALGQRLNRVGLRVVLRGLDRREPASAGVPPNLGALGALRHHVPPP